MTSEWSRQCGVMQGTGREGERDSHSDGRFFPRFIRKSTPPTRCNPWRQVEQLLIPQPCPLAPCLPCRCKPWRWVGHLLGHEAKGSLAHALKQAGLIQVTSARISPLTPFRQLLLTQHVSSCCLPPFPAFSILPLTRNYDLRVSARPQPPYTPSPFVPRAWSPLWEMRSGWVEASCSGASSCS